MDIAAGLRMLRAEDWDFVFSATTFPAPIFRAFFMLPEGGVAMFDPEHFNTRSQDLPEAWHDAGQFYWGTPEAWLEQRRIFGDRSTIVRLPHWRAQDIDTEEDWMRAEMMCRALVTTG